MEFKIVKDGERVGVQNEAGILHLALGEEWSGESFVCDLDTINYIMDCINQRLPSVSNWVEEKKNAAQSIADLIDKNQEKIKEINKLKKKLKEERDRYDDLESKFEEEAHSVSLLQEELKQKETEQVDNPINIFINTVNIK